MSPDSSCFDILTASAQDLTDHLLKYRFKNDEKLTRQFLVAALDQRPLQSAPAPAAAKPLLGDSILLEFEQVSSIAPRGKFRCTVFSNGIRMEATNSSLTIEIPADVVQYAVTFPAPEHCSKASHANPGPKKRKVDVDDTSSLSMGSHPGSIILFVFHPSATVFMHDPNNNKGCKPLTQFCFQLPSVSSDSEQDSWISSIESALPLSFFRIYHPHHTNKPKCFQFISDQEQHTTTSGMPFVKCHFGVQDGALYPMTEGLLFYKPPLFIHRSQLHSISCGRGSSSLSNSSRYVDLVLQLDAPDDTVATKKKKDSIVEFTNIHREEMGVLQHYIHQVLIKAMEQDVLLQEQATKTENMDSKKHESDDLISVEKGESSDDDNDDNSLEEESWDEEEESDDDEEEDDEEDDEEEEEERTDSDD